MITKFDEYKLIKESPDRIQYKNQYLGWGSSNARPFMITVNKNHTEVKELFVGPYGWTHLDMYVPSKVAYAGRFWLDSKIMSFWVYPNIELFKDFIKKLEEKLEIKIFNNDWKIEVLESNGKIKRRDVGKSEFNYFFGTRDVKYTRNYKIIPIEEYVGSEDTPEEIRIQHMMNWKEKEQLKKSGKLKVTGGSHKTAWDSPHNIKYRQSIYKENKNN